MGSDRSILVVGPTPPPFGGQTLMVQALVDGRSTVLPDYEWNFVNVGFSRALNETGKFKMRKAFHLVSLIARIAKVCFTRHPRILYYTPAGPTPLPLARDIILLCLTRPWFDHVIFHFHAGGVSAMYDRLPRILRYLFRRAYWHADLGIKVAVSAPDDPHLLRAKSSVVVPNGIDPVTADAVSQQPGAKQRPRELLFVGLLCESKGVLDLIEALASLRSSHPDLRLRLVGEMESPAFEAALRSLVNRHQLADAVELTGVLLGEDKMRAYTKADVFCFPTYFESETFGLVVVEAMSASLPVVASRWRGVADVVSDGETGILVAPHHPSELAEAIERLLTNPEMAQIMGREGRRRYEELYTREAHLAAMRKAIESVGAHCAPDE
jgi:glycosyltransferase involved in cell wall biosynthesis